MEKTTIMSTRHLVLAIGLVGLCVIALGVLTRGEGLMVPRSHRAALTGARAAVHEELERLESVMPVPRSRDDALWRTYLAIVEQELEQGHIDVAVRAWHDAYGAALESRSWESMIAVGDAFMAIGRKSGAARGARFNAREAYLTALIRARRERSVDGVLRAAEAFRELDDRAVAEQCLHIAAQLAAGDEPAQQRVQEARRRWTAPPSSTGS
jgi:inorganic triphosphatase YgiF